MESSIQYKNWTELINKSLGEYLQELNKPLIFNLYKSMEYSLMAHSKRVRPILAIAVSDLFENDIKIILPYACAIEMIHTYSLIHDDLPAMDNDDFRRGILTNHKMFGEGKAILSGDALLNYAFEIMLEDSISKNNNYKLRLEAISIIAKSTGALGMIGGQIIDMEFENTEISKETLLEMHNRKTGALIKASILAAAAICNATDIEKSCLSKFADNLGLAFQIKDDILDIEGNQEKLGKNVGSDVKNNKSTFVSLFGIDSSKEKLQNITKEAIESINHFGDKAAFLKFFVNLLLKREN